MIDVKGCWKWTFFFRVIGMISITIYMAQKIIPFRSISAFFLDGVGSHLPDVWAAVLIQIGYIVVCWLFLLFLYRKNLFLKV